MKLMVLLLALQTFSTRADLFGLAGTKPGDIKYQHGKYQSMPLSIDPHTGSVKEGVLTEVRSVYPGISAFAQLASPPLYYQAEEDFLVVTDATTGVVTQKIPFDPSDPRYEF